MSLASVSTTYNAFNDLCGYCNEPNNLISLFMNAHAAVSKTDASGNVLQTETAWYIYIFLFMCFIYFLFIFFFLKGDKFFICVS